MRTLTLVAGGASELARRAVEASGAKVAWDAAGPEALAGSLRSTRVALQSSGWLRGALRREMGLYATIRPCLSVPGVGGARPEVDFVLVIEGVKDPEGARKIAHAAFQYAAMHARRKVAVVHDSSLEEDTSFLASCLEAARDYAQLSAEGAELADVSAGLIREPEGCDVLLVPQGHGEALERVAESQLGGPGLVPSAFVGDAHAVYSGGDGPVGMLLAAALALERINEHQACERIRRALRKAGEGRPTSPPDLAERALAELARR